MRCPSQLCISSDYSFPSTISMAPQRTRVSNKWNEDQRIVLHILARRNDLPWPEKTRIFNHIFEQHLLGQGFPKGLPKTSLYVQYCERRKEKHAKIWRDILSPTCTEKAKHQSVLADCIEQKRRELSGHSSAYFTSRSKPPSLNVHATSVHSASKAVPESSSVATREPAQNSTPVAASSGHRIRRGEAATIPFPRRTGITLTLTPTEYASTLCELIPVSRELAHPPLTGLLFRYWHNKSAGLNSTDGGFVAGRFMFTNVKPPPPPECETFKEWSDVFTHLNGGKFGSPYVSVTNNFAWTCRQALGQYEKIGSSVRITVIGASVLDRETVFHAKPYHKELKKKFAFTNGAHRYPATHELLVWHEIPLEAILGTFTVQDLLELEARHISIAPALRLQELGELGRGYRTTILPRWVAQNVGLSTVVIQTIAELCKLVMVSHDSIEHVAYVVSEYITGWGIVKSASTSTQWLKQASDFAEAFVQAKGILSSLPTLTTLQTGFLFGVQLSCGDANALFLPSTARLMRSRAKHIGLEDPAQIFAEQLHDALTPVFAYDNSHRDLLGISSNDFEVRGSFQKFRADVDFRGRPRARKEPNRASKVGVRKAAPQDREDQYDDNEIRYRPRKNVFGVAKSGIRMAATVEHADENEDDEIRYEPCIIWTE